MKILITGFAIFVIWSFFSTWLYTDVLRQEARKPVPEVSIPKATTSTADSLAKLNAMMPKDLTILFDFDRFTFNPDQQLVTGLGDFKSWIERYPGSAVVVTGYTDLVGDDKYNQDLGFKRAQEVQKYLESAGFQSVKLIVVSKGEQDPASGYITMEERAANRRVVVSVKR